MNGLQFSSITLVQLTFACSLIVNSQTLGPPKTIILTNSFQENIKAKMSRSRFMLVYQILENQMIAHKSDHVNAFCQSSLIVMLH